MASRSPVPARMCGCSWAPRWARVPDPMREGQFSPSPSGRAGGVVSRQKPSRAIAVVRPGGPGCQASARARWAGVSSFAGTGLGIDAFGWLLLFADIYNRTTTVTTESQSAQRTHRDFFGRGFEVVSSFAISAGLRANRARQPFSRIRPHLRVHSIFSRVCRPRAG